MSDLIRLYKKSRGKRKQALRAQILTENQGLVYQIARDTYNRMGRPNWCDVEDFVAIANERLIHALEHFDPDRGFKFSTYACVSMKRKLFKAYNEYACVPANYRYADVLELQVAYEDYNVHKITSRYRDYSNLEDLLNTIKSILTAKEYKLLETIYVKGVKFRQLAAAQGVTHQAIHLRMKAILRKLAQRLNKDNF